MSFINLMADDVWSEADIVNRSEALVRSQFSAQEEGILNRKVLGASMGFPLTPQEQLEVAIFQAVLIAARDAGAQARADRALLADVMTVERGESAPEILSAPGLALYEQRAARTPAP